MAPMCTNVYMCQMYTLVRLLHVFIVPATSGSTVEVKREDCCFGSKPKNSAVFRSCATGCQEML